jgi:hypothetical protein
LAVEPGEGDLVKIRLRNPDSNNNRDPVQVDQVDLICGEVVGPETPGTHDDKRGDTNAITRVVGRFETWEPGTPFPRALRLMPQSGAVGGRPYFFGIGDSSSKTAVAVKEQTLLVA